MPLGVKVVLLGGPGVKAGEPAVDVLGVGGVGGAEFFA